MQNKPARKVYDVNKKDKNQTLQNLRNKEVEDQIKYIKENN